MSNPPAPSNGAERARRHRERKRVGAIVAPVEVLPEDLRALVDNMLLEPGKLDDRAAITESIEVLLYVLRENAIQIDWERWD